MMFNVCVKFHENMSSGFKVTERTRKIVYTQRAITQKVEKPELRFMCSARRLMVFNVCVKFHENMSSGFKVMERTRKLLTDTHTHTHTHTHRKDENIIPPWHTSYAGGIINRCFLNTDKSWIEYRALIKILVYRQTLSCRAMNGKKLYL